MKKIISNYELKKNNKTKQIKFKSNLKTVLINKYQYDKRLRTTNDKIKIKTILNYKLVIVITIKK